MSEKKLGPYIDDLFERLKWFGQWIEEGIPPQMKISLFYEPITLLIGSKQNYARKKMIPIDQIEFDFQVLKDHQLKDPPEDGMNVHRRMQMGRSTILSPGKLTYQQ